VSPNELTTRLSYDELSGPLKGVGGFVEVQWKDSFYMDNANLLKAPGYELVNLNVHYKTELASDYFKALNLYLEVRNVLDRTYVASANNIGNSVTRSRRSKSREHTGEYHRLDLCRIAESIFRGNEGGVQMIDVTDKRSKAVLSGKIFTAVVLVLWQTCAYAQMNHQHASEAACDETILRCASKVTPAFGPDGTLWLAWMAGGQVSVASSKDHGYSVSAPVSGDQRATQSGLGPRCASQNCDRSQWRHRIGLLDLQGQTHSTARCSPRDRRTAGRALPSCGRSRLATTASALRRLRLMPMDRCLRPGSISATAFLRAAATAKTTKVPACSLRPRKTAARSIRNPALRRTIPANVARLGLAFAGPGRPVIVFRNILKAVFGITRSMTFADPATPGEVHTAFSQDDWQISACPHHGPSLSISTAGTYHVTWYTSGRPARVYFMPARKTGAGRFLIRFRLCQADRAPSRPYVLGDAHGTAIVWKEFDGEKYPPST